MKTLLLSGLVAVGMLALAQPAQAGTITLDFDTVAGGSDIVIFGSVNTSLGLITLQEDAPGAACIACFGTFPNDLPFGTFGNGLVEAGQFGAIQLNFGFDVQAITFNFGGDGGGFEAFALDSGGGTLDSIIFASNTWPIPGLHTFSGIGAIRALRFGDPIGGAAIDNVQITSATTIPEPSSITLLGTGLGMIGLLGWRRRSARLS